MKSTFAFVFFILSLGVVCAQNVSQVETFVLEVRGSVYERETLDPMPGAAVQLFNHENKVLKTSTTNDKGQFHLSKIPSGDYTVKVSFMGFQTQTFSLKLPKKNGNYRTADVLLREQTQMLAETVVTAKAVEMTVVEDTIQFNAAAFTVPEGSVVEELIKKLPGVELDDDGNITVNGKNVSQILVDGKEFFGNDRSITLKNLPADIVDKIKTFEKKSDNARITGVDDGEETTVLDLTIKKDKKRGWFGNVDGGYGTHNRYEGRVMVNRFVGDRRFSLVGNANNLRRGGRQANQSGGFNYNEKTEKLEMSGNVRLNGGQTKENSWSVTQSFENKDAAFSNRRSSSRGNNMGLNMDFKLEWRPDTMTHILVQPRLNIGRNRSRSMSEYASFSDDPYAVDGITDPLSQVDDLKDLIGVNHNVNANRNEGKSMSGNLSLLYNRRLAKPGRNVGVRVDGGFGENGNSSSSYSQIDYYQILAMTGEDSVYHKVQYNNSPNSNHNVGVNVSYNEPLSQNTFLQFSYNFNYRYQDNNREVESLFDPRIGQLGVSALNFNDYRAYASDDVEQCRFVENKYYNHNIRVQMRLNRTKYNLTFGVNVQPQTSIVEYTKGFKDYDIRRTVVNAAPAIDYRYRFSRQEQFRFTYRGNSGQPGITDLIPDTLDNANPLNVRLGNAELKPSFTHNVEANYNKFVTDVERNYTAKLNFRTTQNAVSNRTEYNPITGGRISKPENINGNWNAGGNFNFNTAFADKRFKFNTNTSANYTNAVGYVYRSQEKETVKNKTGNLSLYEAVRATFRNEWLDVSLNGSIRYNHSKSTATSATQLDTYYFNYGGNAVVKLPWDMEISTDITNNSRRGFSEATMNTDELLWNVRIAQRFLKGNAATVSFRWYDILNRRSDVNRNITAFSRTDSSNEGVYSYCMLNFSYRFNFFGGRRQGGMENESGGRFERGRSEGRNRGQGGGPRGGFGGER